MADKSDAKATLNLPQTSFAMKASLAQKEPETIKRWEAERLYEKILAKRAAAGRHPFILHDGPPYANGHIHMGTAMNKVLKDFIVKSRSMLGYYAPYIPGWDCHGLPIETHVDKQLGGKKKDMPVMAVRRACREYAEKFIGVQRSEFKRLGVLGAWETPYLTMQPAYEAKVLEYLGDFFDHGEVYKGKRPVYWCIHDRTALAEAEIEYKDKTSPSIYVRFEVLSDLGAKFATLAGHKAYVVIWTTTPWTLPANLAIAFHPEYEYAAAEVNGDVYIMAKRLLPVVAEELGWPAPKVLASFPGRELEGLKARHPFIDRESLFVLADYVTLEDGTGCVHTAPGHGADDFLTGQAYGLDIYTPVDDEGQFTPDVPHYAGLEVFEANARITADMSRDGTLLKETKISHSYPHCWRCKNPVIFRATEQWFISMEKGGLRQKSREAIAKVAWIPEWGRDRIDGMVAGRPDWCISRQRSWGVPIPAFRCKACGTPLAGGDVSRHVAGIFRSEGSDAWFVRDAASLVPPGAACPQCGGTDFEKEFNILDVWFESGSSQNVLEREAGHSWPADVYIEGHDQHLGWFNSSLLVGVDVKGGSPFRTCITHGFILDEQGRAMSKSMGNVIDPLDVCKRSGAEIVRLWAAMLNYKEDARFGPENEQRVVEAYRKIRNTWRFLLGNVSDFVPGRDTVAEPHLLDIDRWILHRFEEVRARVVQAYGDYEFHPILHDILDLFTVDLSAFYLDVVKDRAYCSAQDAPERRSAQTAMFTILRDSLLLMAPILPFTAEEAWAHVPDFEGKDPSVHMGEFPGASDWLKSAPDGFLPEMERLLLLREKALKELEKARESKLIGNSLEARVVLKAPAADVAFLEKRRADLAALLIVSQVDVEPGEGAEIGIEVGQAAGVKCERCWNYSTTVGRHAACPTFCERCARAVKSGRS